MGSIVAGSTGEGQTLEPRRARRALQGGEKGRRRRRSRHRQRRHEFDPRIGRATQDATGGRRRCNSRGRALLQQANAKRDARAFRRDRGGDAPAGGHLQYSRANGAPTCCPKRCSSSRAGTRNIAGVKESSGDLKQIGRFYATAHEGFIGLVRRRPSLSSVLSPGRRRRRRRCVASLFSRIPRMLERLPARPRPTRRRRFTLAPAADRRALCDDEPDSGEVGDAATGLQRRISAVFRSTRCPKRRGASAAAPRAVRVTVGRGDVGWRFLDAASTRSMPTGAAIAFSTSAPRRSARRSSRSAPRWSSPRRMTTRFRAIVNAMRALAVRHGRCAGGGSPTRRGAARARHRRRTLWNVSAKAPRCGGTAGLFPGRRRRASPPMPRRSWKCAIPAHCCGHARRIFHRRPDGRGRA